MVLFRPHPPQQSPLQFWNPSFEQGARVDSLGQGGWLIPHVIPALSSGTPLTPMHYRGLNSSVNSISLQNLRFVVTIESVTHTLTFLENISWAPFKYMQHVRVLIYRTFNSNFHPCGHLMSSVLISLHAPIGWMVALSLSCEPMATAWPWPVCGSRDEAAAEEVMWIDRNECTLILYFFVILVVHLDLFTYIYIYKNRKSTYLFEPIDMSQPI